VGKPGSTAKLKEKIFFTVGIFPRQSRLPAGTDFFQVNKNAQLVGKHLINEARNLKYQKSRSTKSFQGNFHGQHFFNYLWNNMSWAEFQNFKLRLVLFFIFVNLKYLIFIIIIIIIKSTIRMIY
jgi:hypothetical protein